MRYYDLEKNWDTVKKHIESEAIQRRIKHEFDKFASIVKGTSFSGYPADWSRNNDWMNKVEPSERPEYWKYVCIGACKQLANVSLALSRLCVEDQTWRIINGETHSTVWNGEDVVFDFIYQAVGLPALECFEDSCQEILEPNQYNYITGTYCGADKMAILLQVLDDLADNTEGV